MVETLSEQIKRKDKMIDRLIDRIEELEKYLTLKPRENPEDPEGRSIEMYDASELEDYPEEEASE